MTARTRYSLVLFLILAVTGAVYFWFQQTYVGPIPKYLQGVGGDFTLKSADGPVSLKDFRGKVVLLYFGYTNCPDICPTTLSNWADAFHQLDKNEQLRVRGLFVSVDPKRDTPKKLKEYTNYFDPNIIGVTGSHKNLVKIASSYHSSFSLENGGKGDNYTVEHMSFVYVIDPQGKVRDMLSHESTPADIVKSIRNALKVRV
jgi:protein SCO1/2